jgi:hypothetical protein
MWQRATSVDVLLTLHTKRNMRNAISFPASKFKSYVTTDGHSASRSWNKSPIWGLGPDSYYFQTVAGFFMWGSLFDERTGLSFTISFGPRQRSHSRIRVPWDSRPHSTVSGSRLPFSSPPATRRVTVGVFDSAPTWDIPSIWILKECLYIHIWTANLKI